LILVEFFAWGGRKLGFLEILKEPLVTLSCNSHI
jgi:hypothetical protein